MIHRRYRRNVKSRTSIPRLTDTRTGNAAYWTSGGTAMLFFGFKSVPLRVFESGERFANTYCRTVTARRVCL
jgi:hypothetical protein